jgi:hypothetical protein
LQAACQHFSNVVDTETAVREQLVPNGFRTVRVSEAIRGRVDMLKARPEKARSVLKGAKGAVLTSGGEAGAC